MLERLIVRNFKLFDEVDIELGQTVVFVGPNNSGKTSALQALALWELGVRRWSEKRGGKPAPKKRSGVTLNRRDLVALPVPDTNLLWRDLHVREGGRSADGKQKTENIRVDVEVHGVTTGRIWSCGLEFDYANAESIYCRPLGWAAGGAAVEDPIPSAALGVRVAYLPPMSGLASNEVRLDPGAVQVRLGEGRTAEVLRNLCHALTTGQGGTRWEELVRRMRDLFGVTVSPPVYVTERGELVMSYRDQRSVVLDMTAAGRGLQQTMLLLAFLLGNPGSTLLLDEPDAHLEILRQQQIYNAITEVAGASGSQVIAASHSEVILNEAAHRDVVVAFVGQPHRIDDGGSQVLKALKSIGFEQYYLAETTGWVLYLEGATDLAVLRAFARTLGHEAAALLERPFAHYVSNQPQKAREHFYGLREAKHDLVGLVVTDDLGREETSTAELGVVQWSRREIENYLCFPDVLESYAASLAAEMSAGPLFEGAEVARFRETMRACVAERVPPAALRDPADRWWRRVKASDELLDPVFESFFERIELPNLMRKTDYHRLASLVPADRIDDEVRLVLDRVVAVARAARPLGAGTAP
ncbi:MAG: AAA family ATPase [Deltaproteobacteria bacterium]|nr:AAA family ATPase [Deltaproteobacteria bacterium]